MKYKYAVTAYATKLVEIEADNENAALDQLKNVIDELEFTADDIDGYERDWFLLD